MSGVRVQRLGLTTLANGERDGSKPVANIVFVHGLRGHPRYTWEHKGGPQSSAFEKEEPKRSSSRLFHWRSNKWSPSSSPISPSSPTRVESEHVDATSVYWPQDLLPGKVQNARILTYGYNADVIGSLFEGANQNNISQHGRDLMLQLEREVGGEPIIFVAHSLGGILVKEGLHWSKFNSIPKYKSVHRCTRHVVFLGVPHRGSPMADTGATLARLANAALIDANRPLVNALAIDGEILDRIHTEFMKMVLEQDFSVHSFQEGRGLSGMKGFSEKVVNDFSSQLGFPLEVVETIDANHMQMARFRDAEDPGYRKVSNVITDYIKQTQQDEISSRPTPTPKIDNTSPAIAVKRYFRVPHIMNKNFVGRGKELEWLESNLEDPAMDGEQQRVVIWGPGGAGKTQLVSTFALRHRSSYSAVFWVTATSDFTLRRTYAAISKHIGLAASAGDDQQTAIDSARDWLTDREPGDWLLIIDNADDLDETDIEAFIPPVDRGSVIITSRNRQAAAFGPALELGEMDTKDATTLLTRRAAIQHLTANDHQHAIEIVESLGNLALAIEHAGAYIQSVGGTLQDYQLQFQSNRRRMLENSPRISMHKESVFETFRLSFNILVERNSAAARLMSFFGFLDADAIWESLLLTSNEKITTFYARVIKDRQEFQDAIKALLSFSLIDIVMVGERKSITLHPLVHYLSRARLKPDNQWRWKENAISWLLQSTIATNADKAYFPHIRNQMQQLQELAEPAPDSGKRRRVYCYLALLQWYYIFAWQISGMMSELHRSSERVQAVLDEDLTDEEYYSMVGMVAVMEVQFQTVEYVASTKTDDAILREYIVKRMKPSAASSLEKANKTDASNRALQSATGTESLPTSNAHLTNRGLFKMSSLMTALTDEIVPKPEIWTKEAEDASINGGIRIARGPNTIPNTLERGYERGTSEDLQASTSQDVGSKEQPTSDGSPLQESVSTATIPEKTVDQHRPYSFEPKVLSDIFISTESPIQAQSLLAGLNNLIKVYYSHHRVAEADLLLSWSTLPNDKSQNDDRQSQSSISESLISASRFAARGDLDGVISICRQIIDRRENTPAAYLTAVDYGIMMNNLRQPAEAERAMKQAFYRTPGQTEQDLAKDLQSYYIWVKKTISVSYRLHGQIEEASQTLLLTLDTANELFGINSLSTLHAAFLLYRFYDPESYNTISTEPMSLTNIDTASPSTISSDSPSTAGTLSPSSTRTIFTPVTSPSIMSLSSPLSPPSIESHKSISKSQKYKSEFTSIFEKLYGPADGRPLGEEGLQMGMILWAQGALEEAVGVIGTFAELATKHSKSTAEALGGQRPKAEDIAMAGVAELARKARRAERVVRREWEEAQLGKKEDILRFGTIIFPRKMEDLDALIKEDRYGLLNDMKAAKDPYDQLFN